MRSHEFPTRLVLNVLKNRDIAIRSPNAKKLWIFGKDIIEFYVKLIGNLDQYIVKHYTAGNVGSNIVKNTTLAKMVAKIGHSNIRINSRECELGELDGKSISFDIESQSPMWKSKHTLEEELTKTYKWFEKTSLDFIPYTT